MSETLLLMILLPFVGSLLNGLVLRPRSAKKAGVIATLSAAGSFVAALVLWQHLNATHQPIDFSYPWFSAGRLEVDWEFRFDWLTALMALVVTGIGTLIHLYSIGYMSHDPSPSRYFAYLNLFLGNMLILICGASLPVMFVGWEGVGLCSYLLIGFWFTDIEKANAGIKAFILNRIGDASFLLGMFLIFQVYGTLSFAKIAAGIGAETSHNISLINMMGLLLFIGATGKSAQIPLYVWLPDAMAGPTPVSALIHAATMVTAGIYLIARMHFLYVLAPDTSAIIAIVGVSTALLAALIATSQNDIKKVLAYSTVSQLGLMFVALGTGAYVAALFHVMTHAFFKACMFLGAGSVIHALDGEQDIMQMGGLRKKLPITFVTFGLSTLAIAGIPPLAGFFSKDLILYSSLTERFGYTLWFLGSLASALTAFYMARLLALTFFGEYRGHAHPHESPLVMTLPLMILAVGSVFAGFLGFPEEFHILPNVLGEFLTPVFGEEHHVERAISETGAMVIATAVAVFFTSLGIWLFAKPSRAASVAGPFSLARKAFENKLWIDELYGFLFLKPFEWSSKVLYKVVDVKFIDGTVLFPGRVSRLGGTILSFVQAGSSQFYLLVMLAGGCLVFWLTLKGVLV